MADYSSYEIREVDLNSRRELNALISFLNENGLRYEKLDHAEVVVDSYDESEKILACGGFEGNTLKGIAVSPALRGEGLMDMVVSRLLGILLTKGYENIFVFTKPENLSLFVSQGFTLVARAEKAIFLERGRPGAKEFSESLEAYRKEGKNGCIVMNANPFTLGHRYLAETAAKEVDNLYIFVVETERSVFPFETRKRLVESGTRDLKNTTVLSGGKYIISNSVFPSYFIKEMSDVTKTHAELDVALFRDHIAPPLGISTRFVGSEDVDEVTRVYNETMKRLLPFEVREIKRKERGGKIISASEVRKLIASGDHEKVKELVPETTYSFLVSQEGRTIAERIKEKAQQQ